VRLLAATAAALIALSGCGFKGAYSLPLPGGAAHGKTYHVTAIFDDVQDLTPQAAVRVNDVAVGDVTSISLGPKDLKAHVGMIINNSVTLPQNAVATLEQTTLLGEKFVAISAPTGTAPVGRLADGDIISDQDGGTSDLPSVEEVFGLLSQVLNGGDLADLQTINVEVSKALAGRETAVRGALTQLTTFVTGLNHQKQQIVRALDSLNRFSSALATQNGTIATALDDLGPGLHVLADERAQFTALLTDLSKFGQVATHIIQSSRTQTITDLRDLQPILRHLSAAGAALPRSLEILITFPFPRDSGEASPGDYTNLSADVDLTPVLCAALTQLGAQGALKLITDPSGPGGLIGQLLGDENCPSSGSSASALNTPKAGHHASGRAGGTSSGGTATSGTSPSPSPTPSPTSSGLAGLLNSGLGGGITP
jgi:phospholipid/cholesterol/gamma-HCH transport system substrate-binding protein